MHWQLDWGGQSEALEDLADVQRKLPKALEDRPIIYPDLFPVWEGFWALSAARNHGFMPQPLSFQEIESYLRLRQVKEDDWADMIFYWQKMDQAFLKAMQKKQELSSSSQSSQKRKGAKR